MHVRLHAILAAALASTLLAPGLAAAQRRKPNPKAEQPGTPAAVEPAPAPSPVNAAALKSFKAREIGPAIMSGRVSDIALDPVDPATFYIGLATGGVMRTTNEGASFDPIFSKEAAASIGDIAIAPSDPKTIWVGTGEANDRNSSGWGAGVYRSTDGGSTWASVGLGESRTIARIVVKADDPNTAWVAAMGDLWTPNTTRGLYKTTDGGSTWRLVLQAPAPYNDRVGCGDVAIDPTNSNVLYATLYARRRTPWDFTAGPLLTDGKDLGGVFKSTDGGETWRKLSTGLPPNTQRIGLDIFRKDPRIVYAVIQSDDGGPTDGEIYSKRGGVFRSEDSGETWRRMSPLDPRPFYFSQIRVDPENDKRVYVLGFGLHVSDNGGESWREDLFKKVHPDCHAFAIDPRNPKRVFIGTDGGPYMSYEAGQNWRHFNNFSAGQFYRVTVDASTPYRVAGGLQDNLNWVGPSDTRSKDGITNADWINIGGGDGFYCVFDPDNPNIVYGESQQGYIFRFDLKSGAFKSLRPEPAEGQPGFRFHWCTPFFASQHAKGVMYLAGNRVFRLTNSGETWTLISPDLSKNDLSKATAVGSGAENYGVIYTLAESPAKAGMLWAGTDDGNVWVTENDGAAWTDLSANIPDSARGQWVNRIEPSAHDANVAYITFDAHRAGNYAPMVYRTADGGKTWKSIVGDLPTHGPVRVIRESSRNPNLLFAGTEFGLFASLDGGAHWLPFGAMPTVAVDDLVIHPRERDLVVATHGRSLFIVDDISPLEAFGPETTKADMTFFPVHPAFGINQLPGWADWGGVQEYRGANPPMGAGLNFFIREFTGDSVSISVTNAAGLTVANLSAPGTPGFNRVVWDLKPTKDLLNDYSSEGQKFLKPGEYTVTLVYGKTKATQKVQVSVAEGIETR